jgi:hypothetical protein
MLRRRFLEITAALTGITSFLPAHAFSTVTAPEAKPRLTSRTGSFPWDKVIPVLAGNLATLAGGFSELRKLQQFGWGIRDGVLHVRFGTPHKELRIPGQHHGRPTEHHFVSSVRLPPELAWAGGGSGRKLGMELHQKLYDYYRCGVDVQDELSVGITRVGKCPTNFGAAHCEYYTLEYGPESTTFYYQSDVNVSTFIDSPIAPDAQLYGYWSRRAGHSFTVHRQPSSIDADMEFRLSRNRLSC